MLFDMNLISKAILQDLATEIEKVEKTEILSIGKGLGTD